MTDKEQIIINGINIFDTLDEWADLISQNWCSAEYLTAEIIKNHILGINKQLARKTQKYEALTNTNRIHAEIIEELNNKYNDLKEDYKELEQRHNGAFQDFERLKQECEELKSKNSILKNSLKPFQDEYFKNLETIVIASLAKKSIRITAENTQLRKALEVIEGMLQVIVESNKVYPLQSNLYKILDIISKAKGEEWK